MVPVANGRSGKAVVIHYQVIASHSTYEVVQIFRGKRQKASWVTEVGPPGRIRVRWEGTRSRGPFRVCVRSVDTLTGARSDKHCASLNVR